MNEAVVNDCEV